MFPGKGFEEMSDGNEGHIYILVKMRMLISLQRCDQLAPNLTSTCDVIGHQKDITSSYVSAPRRQRYSLHISTKLHFRYLKQFDRRLQTLSEGARVSKN